MEFDSRAALDKFATPAAISEAVVQIDKYEEGQPSWVDVACPDLAAGRAFYSALFGWEALQRMDMGPSGIYLIFGVVIIMQYRVILARRPARAGAQTPASV